MSEEMEDGSLESSVSGIDLRSTTDRQLSMNSHVVKWHFKANTLLDCTRKEH